jgi:Sulfotransferase domain
MRSVSPPAKRAVQAVSVAAGRMSGQPRMLPGFLIVGAQRSGTTSMYRALSQHPAVLKAVLHKGVHYFDMNYGRGFDWYLAHFPSAARARSVRRSIGIAPLTFESSPYYMFHPLAAERIASDLPDVKLLVLVRDPVERAYSAHAHESARGYEHEDFQRALELEDDRLAGEAERMAAEPGYLSYSHQHYAYRARGQYAEQLDVLERHLGRDRILVVDSGDFFTAPQSVYNRVLEFLGLPQGGSPVFEQHNARPRPVLSNRLQAKLNEHFLPFDDRLRRWLEDGPSWRRPIAGSPT